MQPTLVDIEYAHIYAGEVFGEQEKESAGIAAALKANYQGQSLRVCAQAGSTQRAAGATSVIVSTTVLVDDYHGAPEARSESEIQALLLSEAGIAPDRVVLESSLAPLAEEILATLPKAMLRRESFERGTRQVTFATLPGRRVALVQEGPGVRRLACPLLTAAWYLHRFQAALSVASSLDGGERASCGKIALISVLQEKYKENEETALVILSLSGRDEVARMVHHHFFRASGPGPHQAARESL